jgi:hypothetical protein
VDNFDVNNFSDDFFGHLNEEDKRRFIEVCYQKILLYPKLLIDHDSPALVKKNSINVLIKYFEECEEYEKCAELKKIINIIHGRKNNSTDK